MTTHAVANPADAWQIVFWYKLRWVIEQFFRSMKKEGLSIEDSQLETAEGLIKLVAIAAKAACIVIQLVQARNGGEELPAEFVFSAEEIEVLRAINNKTYKATTKLQTNHHRPRYARMGRVDHRKARRMERLCHPPPAGTDYLPHRIGSFPKLHPRLGARKCVDALAASRGRNPAALFASIFQLEYSRDMSATRLLVLGAVRIFQPIHGYDLRRELMSWHADEWANISFGSIYFALKKMTADGLLEEVETERSGARPEKTLYRLTVPGEKEFQSLLREYFWQRKPLIDPFLVAMSQMPAMPKPELIAALRHRATTARATIEQLRFEAKAQLAAKSDFAGEELAGRFVAEMLELSVIRLAGEADWADSLAARIESGAFRFPDEPFPPGYAAGQLGKG